MKTKYWFCSDIHGINPNNFHYQLLNAGFVKDNPHHKLVIAGDITDGGHVNNIYDNDLVNYLKNFGPQLIIIKGNHDRGMYLAIKAVRGVMFDGTSDPRQKLTKENRAWLAALPEQIETEHFLLAHGMYMFEDSLPGTKNRRVMSTWASPVLLGKPVTEYFGMGVHGPWCGRKLNERYKNIAGYEKELHKPLYLGHFTNAAVDYHMKGRDYEIDGPFRKFGKITFLDTNTKGTSIVNFKVVEY